MDNRGSMNDYNPRYVPIDLDNNDYCFFDTNTGKRAKGSSTYNYATYFYDDISIVSLNDSLSFINERFKPISSEVYSEATLFNNGIAYSVKPNSHIVAIDKNGKPVFTLKEAEYAYRFSDGVSVFITNEGKYGLVNTRGTILIRPGEYAYLGPFAENGMIRAAIKTHNGYKEGIINYNKKELIPCEYSHIQFTSEPSYKLMLPEEGDKSNHSLTECYYSGNDDFPEIPSSKEYFIIIKDGKRGLINKKNKEILPVKYSNIIVQQDGLFMVRTYSSKVFWIDRRGNEIIPPLFSDAYPFINEPITAAASLKSESYGFIDKEGEWVLPPRFDYVGCFRDDGLAIVINEDGAGAINGKGELVIKQLHEDLIYLGNNKYLATTDSDDDSEVEMIDSNGKYLSKINCTHIVDPLACIDNHSMVQSHYVNIDKVVNEMIEELKNNSVDTLSLKRIEQRYGNSIRGYGWKEVYSKNNNLFSTKLFVNVNSQSGYSFYGGYYERYYLTGIRLIYQLRGKTQNSFESVFSSFAHKLCAKCIIDKDGNVTGDQSLKQNYIPECDAALLYDKWNDCIEIYFTPISGSID